jgi:predicted nucleic acid-binding protein
MSDKRFFDTNILVYAHDTSAGAKHAVARKLIEESWDRGNGVISTQILQELIVCLQRKVARPRDWDSIREVVTDYLRWEVVVNSAESVFAALEIQERHSLSFWDALVIQAAESAGAAVLYTEDLSQGRVFGMVQAVNPFLAPPSQPAGTARQ